MGKPGHWVQLELKLAAGAEAWYIVRHRGGWFKVPADVTLQEVARGVAEGWQSSPRVKRSNGSIRVPLDEYLRLVSAGGERPPDAR